METKCGINNGYIVLNMGSAYWNVQNGKTVESTSSQHVTSLQGKQTVVVLLPDIMTLICLISLLLYKVLIPSRSEKKYNLRIKNVVDLSLKAGSTNSVINSVSHSRKADHSKFKQL